MPHPAGWIVKGKSSHYFAEDAFISRCGMMKVENVRILMQGDWSRCGRCCHLAEVAKPPTVHVKPGLVKAPKREVKQTAPAEFQVRLVATDTLNGLLALLADELNDTRADIQLMLDVLPGCSTCDRTATHTDKNRVKVYCWGCAPKGSTLLSSARAIEALERRIQKPKVTLTEHVQANPAHHLQADVVVSRSGNGLLRPAES